MVDPVLTAALAQDNVVFFAAMKIDLPGRSLYFLDGAGVLVIDGNTYSGEDSEFGTVAAIDIISEDIGDSAPELLVSLYPKDGVAASTLANPAMQGATVTIMVGAINPATGLTVGTPEIKFLGEIDVPTLIAEQNKRIVEFTVVSIFERLFELDEGIRASDGYHQSIWPGERGLEYMTGTNKNLYWGAKKPAGQTGSGYTNGAGGGGSAARFADYQNIRSN